MIIIVYVRLGIPSSPLLKRQTVPHFGFWSSEKNLLCELVYTFNMKKKIPNQQTNNKNPQKTPNQTQKAKPKANK